MGHAVDQSALAARGLPTIEPYEGSTRGHYCMACGCEVWLGPSQRQHRDEHPDVEHRVGCALCIVAAQGGDAMRNYRRLSAKTTQINWPPE